MKLYDFGLAPNPRRVRMFLAEKSIEVPMVQVNTREREQFSDEFRAVNPFSVVPVLELDDGTRIGESAAICRYFEEIQPAPPLMGVDAKDKAIVEMWDRRAEIHGFMAAGDAVRNSAPMFEDRALAGEPSGVPQIPALVERGKAVVDRFLHKIDPHLAENEFLAGARFSIADITLTCAIGFAARAEIAMPDACSNVARWYAAMTARPSASA